MAKTQKKANYTKKNYNRKGKGNYEPSSKGSDVDKCYGNDIAWWNKDKSTYDYFNRIPFNIPTGTAFKFGSTLNAAFEAGIDSTPGFQVIPIIPTIGFANSVNDAVNRTFTSLTNNIYAKSSGAMTTFQPADVAHVVLGISSIASNIAHAKKSLDILRTFSNENYYYPRVAYKACGYDYDDRNRYEDEVKNIANTIARLNILIANFNSLQLPAFVDVTNRHYSLFRHVYLDDEQMAAQSTIFIPKGYYVYTDTAEGEEPNQLVYNTFTNERMADISALLNVIDTQLQAMRNSSGVTYILSYLIRYFEGKSLFSINPYSDSSYESPKIDMNINEQIRNMYTLGDIIDTTTLTITQNSVKNCVICEPKGKLPDSDDINCWSMQEFILDSSTGNTDQEFCMEATRLTPWIYRIDNLNVGYIKCGTEIPCSPIYYTIFPDGTIYSFSGIGSIMSNEVVETHDFMVNYAWFTKFKYRPRIYVWLHSVGAPVGFYSYNLGDMYKYTKINTESLDGLRITAMNSVYGALDNTSAI